MTIVCKNGQLYRVVYRKYSHTRGKKHIILPRKKRCLRWLVPIDKVA